MIASRTVYNKYVYVTSLGLELTLSMANVQLHIEELRKRFVELSKKDLEPETIKPVINITQMKL